jgi:hypothetical protein
MPSSTSSSAPSGAHTKMTTSPCPCPLPDLEPYWIACARNAHAIVEAAADQHANAMKKALQEIVDAAATLATIHAEGEIAQATGGTVRIPSKATVINTFRKFHAATGPFKEALAALAKATRQAGYAEAQADLVLELMLTEEGRAVLAGLTAIANDTEEITSRNGSRPRSRGRL